MKKNNVTNICMCALFGALTCIYAQIIIPIPPVPISFSTFSVMVAGGILGWKYGAISQTIYVLLGIVGVPVFAGFTGGAGAVFGKTGGYILGYIIGALVIGLISHKFKMLPYKVVLPISMVAGTAVIYTFGTAWFMVITGATLIQSLMWCVIPFLIGDAVKIVLACILVYFLNKSLRIVK